MPPADRTFKAVVSSDWSECLSPSGPFDPIFFTYPDMEADLRSIFRRYTGNEISLTEATSTIRGMLRSPFTPEQMDAYLKSSFTMYTGATELIQWCLDRDILFMLNTTGTTGYFQRALALGLLPQVPVVASNPLIRFPEEMDEERFPCFVEEIDHKPLCTERTLARYGLSPKALAIMGDSGGDGPHFRWGAEVGAFLIANMPKHSLVEYCLDAGARIDRRFGVAYGPGAQRDVNREMQVDYRELIAVLQDALGIT